MTRFIMTSAFAAALGMAALPAHAVVLNFSGLDAAAYEGPLDYYDGGYGSLGTGPGPNYGITFSSNVSTGISADQPGGNSNVAGVPGSPPGYAIAGSSSVYTEPLTMTMDVLPGFETGVSFYYSTIYIPGSVTVSSGLDGAGTLLATLDLPVTPSDAGASPCVSKSAGWFAAFCPFVAKGVAFAGTAESVEFTGDYNALVLADITTGSVTPGVPEPSTWALLALGFAGLGFAGHRKSRVAALFAARPQGESRPRLCATPTSRV